MASALLRRAIRLRLSSSSAPIPSRGRALLHSSSLVHRSEPRVATSPSPPFLVRFSSSKPRPAASRASPDQILAVALDSEIRFAKESLDSAKKVELPDGFPFEIIDNPGDQAVILKREFDGETIQVNAFMDIDSTEDVDEEGDDEDSNEDDAVNSPRISLLVTVQKGDGPTLEFGCTLLHNELEIESMLLKKQDDPDEECAYHGPPFSDLDENLQKGFYEYLRARGIESSLFDFLQEYMGHKDDKEYLAWLKNMKEFVEK